LNGGRKRVRQYSMMLSSRKTKERGRLTQQNMPRPIDSAASHSLQSKYTCLHQMCTFDILVRFHGYQTDRSSLEFGGKLRRSALSVPSLGVSRSVTLLSNYEAFNTPAWFSLHYPTGQSALDPKVHYVFSRTRHWSLSCAR